MATARKIIHIDMDAFYASIEQRDRPELRGRPIVVGGSPASRGVVCSASYEARRYGVRSAIPCSQAKRLCPEAIFVMPRISYYATIGRELRAIFHEATPLVEPLSLDEAYLDVTENRWGETSATRIAERLQGMIRDRLSLTASAGVAPNKLVAKIASDVNKPRGLTVVRPEQVQDFLDPLLVGKISGVGPATIKLLNRVGIQTIRDLRLASENEMTQVLGRHGRYLLHLARGEDNRDVDPGWDPKSRGVEETFSKDLTEPEELCAILERQAEELAEDLERIQRPGRTLTLKVRYDDFSTVTRSQTFPDFIREKRVISETARRLLLERTEALARPVRLLGISMSGLLDPAVPLQLPLGAPIC